MPILFGNFFSGPDLMIVALLALLFFGNRLPTVMRSLGEGITEFKKGMNGTPSDSENVSNNANQPSRMAPRALDDRAPVNTTPAVTNNDNGSNGHKFDDSRKPEERPV